MICVLQLGAGGQSAFASCESDADPCACARARALGTRGARAGERQRSQLGEQLSARQPALQSRINLLQQRGQPPATDSTGEG